MPGSLAVIGFVVLMWTAEYCARDLGCRHCDAGRCGHYREGACEPMIPPKGEERLSRRFAGHVLPAAECSSHESGEP